MDTIGAIGEIMNAALAQYPCASPPLEQENWRSEAVAEQPLHEDWIAVRNREAHCTRGGGECDEERALAGRPPR